MGNFLTYFAIGFFVAVLIAAIAGIRKAVQASLTDS